MNKVFTARTHYCANFPAIGYSFLFLCFTDVCVLLSLASSVMYLEEKREGAIRDILFSGLLWVNLQYARSRNIPATFPSFHYQAAMISSKLTTELSSISIWMKHFSPLEGTSSFPVKGIKWKHDNLLGFVLWSRSFTINISHSDMTA